MNDLNTFQLVLVLILLLLLLLLLTGSFHKYLGIVNFRPPFSFYEVSACCPRVDHVTDTAAKVGIETTLFLFTTTATYRQPSNRNPVRNGSNNHQLSSVLTGEFQP